MGEPVSTVNLEQKMNTQQLIALLGLQPHPLASVYFRRTYSAPHGVDPAITVTVQVSLSSIIVC